MIRLLIRGQPCSKANSRRLVTIGKHTVPIKSKEALRYERDALLQIPTSARVRLEGPVRVTLRLYYLSELSDLDESIVLDVMQDRWAKRVKGEERVLLQAGVYRNDRQVREKHVYHAIDKANPRAEIEIEPRQAQQQAMPLLPADQDPF